MKSERTISFLLVEDNPDHAELIRLALERERIDNRIFHVTDGEQAVAYLKRVAPYEAAPRPDVVLLDLKLPKIGGFEVLEKIRAAEHLRDLWVIILTSSTDCTDLERARSLDPDGYLVKPVAPDAFRKLLLDVSKKAELQLLWEREYDTVW